MIEENKNY